MDGKPTCPDAGLPRLADTPTVEPSMPTPPAPLAGSSPPVAPTALSPTAVGVQVALRVIGLLVLVGVGLWLLVTLRAIALQVLFAVILAAGLRPLVDRLQAAGLPRALAVLLIYLLLILALVALMVAVIPPVVDQVAEVVDNLPVYSQRVTDGLRDLRQRFPFLPPLDEQVVAQARALGGQLGALASQALVVARFAANVFGALLSTFLLLLITLYLIVDGPRIREYFISFLAPERRPRVRAVMDRMGLRMGGWLVGQVTLSVTVGLVSFVGLSLLGVPGAVVLAVLAAIGEAIPIVGPVASAVPAVIVAATTSPVLALLTAGLFLGIQQVENNLLVPKVMERAVKLHPLAVVLALLAGAGLQGIVGAIVAVPVAAAVSVVLDEIRGTSGEPPAARGTDEPPDAHAVAEGSPTGEVDAAVEGEPPRGVPTI